MGSFRRGLILALFWPTAALAEVCGTARPSWDGTQASVWSETLYLITSPLAALLMIASALAIRFRNQLGSALVVLLWAGFVSWIVFRDPGGVAAAARAEGCVGSPALFILVVIAICVAMILTTAPQSRRPR